MKMTVVVDPTVVSPVFHPCDKVQKQRRPGGRNNSPGGLVPIVIWIVQTHSGFWLKLLFVPKSRNMATDIEYVKK